MQMYESAEFEYRLWLLGESMESRGTVVGGYRNGLPRLSLPVEDAWYR